MLRSIGILFSIVVAIVVAGNPSGAAQKAKRKTAAVGAAQPTLLGQYADWGAYAAMPDGHKVCFALGKPKSMKTDPPNRRRDPAYLFVSTRPAENVHNEVSVIMGYPLKVNSDATVEIGSVKFALYTQNDGAWIKNVAEEARLVEAMRKGSDMTIRGISTHNTKTIDVYSLKGVSEAVDRATTECK